MNEKVEISLSTEYTGPTNITQAFEKMRRLLSNAAADAFEEGEGTEVIKDGTKNLEIPEADKLKIEIDVSETIEVSWYRFVWLSIHLTGQSVLFTN